VQQIALTKWDWATLLKRAWRIDVLTCSGCGGRTWLIAVIKDRAVIERILKHIGEDAEEETACVAHRLGRRGFGDFTGRACRHRVGRVACRQGGPHGPWPGEFQSATSWRNAMNAAARVGGSGVVAGRGGLIRVGRGREGVGCSNVASRWSSVPRERSP
jgi:hypothetical protein